MFFVVAQGVDVNIKRIVDPPDRDIALFPVSLAVVLAGYRRAKVEPLGDPKVDTMLRKITAALRFIPRCHEFM